MIKEIPPQRIPEIKTQSIQPHIQEIQIQRPEPQTIQQTHPLIITNLNPTMLNGQQLIQTANGQIIQAQIGQFVQGPNNTIQMITTNPTPQPQLLQIRPEHDNRLTELIVQPTEIAEPQFYEEIPVVLQSANGQQTIVNLPHHQLQSLQQQVHQQQQAQMQQVTTTTSSSEQDEIEIHEVQNYDDDEYGCDDMEEVIEDDIEQEMETSTNTTYYLHQRHSVNNDDNSEVDQEIEDKQLLAQFITQHTHSENPGKHICNLCQQEFKHVKWLESHMKTIHSNWIKANCKKQPQCNICHKSFRGPGMLKMHQKVRNLSFLLKFFSAFSPNKRHCLSFVRQSIFNHTYNLQGVQQYSFLLQKCFY